MRGRTVGVILLLLGSILLGLVVGHFDWILFKKAIPPTMVSSLNLATAKGAAISYGMVVGGAFFVWGLLVALVSPIFRRRKDRTG
jgi:hypothetical protein